MSALTDSIADLVANPRQWQAFEAEGHVVVVAPPGSGKTKLLATRAASDLATKVVAPRGICCITMTNAAANELRRRCLKLGMSIGGSTFIGTVHGFALNRVIKPYAAVAGRAELTGLAVASDGQIAASFDAAIAEVYGGSGADTRNVKSTVQRLNKLMASRQRWALSGPKVTRVGAAYRRRMREQGLTDFDECIAEAVSIVEQCEVARRALAARHARLYVDEYQDLAPGLDRLVRALCLEDSGTEVPFFAVGDPDQAIFGFTGTRSECLAELSAEAGVTTVPLEINYRSRQEIVRVANLLRAEGTPPTHLRGGGAVVAHRSRDARAEISDAATRVQNIESGIGTALNEIAVLCPSNVMCDLMAAELRTRGLPVQVRASDYPATALTLLLEGCAVWATQGRETSGRRLADLLRTYRSLAPRVDRGVGDVALVQHLLDSSDGDASAAQFLLDLLESGGFDSFVDASGSPEDAAAVDEMVGYVRGSGLSIADLSARALNAGSVVVTTLTSSKGLEFDRVIIIGANRKLMPFVFASSAEELAEERRKLYVSLTRARDAVDIYYSGQVAWSRRTETTGPSPYLRDLGLLSREQPGAGGARLL